jgi:chromosome partitioning protein
MYYVYLWFYYNICKGVYVLKVITIANQKGGVCKSTTAQAITEIFNRQQQKTLMIDLDPQGSLSFAVDANPNKPTIYNVLKGELKAKDILQTTFSGDILPANILLSGADLEFNTTGREYLLKEAISEIKQQYSYIVIDCPPSLNILTINALVAGNFVVIPALADVFSLQGMGQLNETIQSVIKYCNQNLKIAGILLTKFTQRNNISQIIKEELNKITKQMNTKLFDANIRPTIALQEAQLQQKCIYEYALLTNAIEDYRNFVSELEEIINE